MPLSYRYCHKHIIILYFFSVTVFLFIQDGNLKQCQA